jgi:FAD/FMN-containing dehydrogenase/Fe-S oxidoreductase
MNTAHREIPFNYTSADDRQVVRILLGPEAWEALESLRGQRVTGRSARLLLRFLGEAFVLRRNPFAFQELVDDPAHRRAFMDAASHDLDLVAEGAAGQPVVLDLVTRCRGLLKGLVLEVSGCEQRRLAVRRRLGGIVGEANVLFDPFSLVSHATDATDWRLYLPACVAFVTAESQVAPLLEAIEALGLKAIPRGAGTGLTGGAVPLAANCVMVNTERLDRLIAVRQEDFGGRQAWVLEAQAGLVTETAMEAARAKGLVFATDPTSAWACTLGGNIAENAGGKTAVLWGTAIDNVLSWRMALPRGRRCEVRRLEHPLRKIQPGDLLRWQVTLDGEAHRVLELRGDEIRKRGLWKDITNKALGGLPGLQKEGCDGVITGCSFVLHPEYEHKATACIEFWGPDMEEASRVILGLSREFPDQGAETLQALEHFDDEYVAAIGYKAKAAREGRPRAVLLLDLVGHDAGQIARGQQRLKELLGAFADSELFVAEDPAQAGAWWADRKKLGAIAKRTNAFKLNEDVVLPLERLADFAAFIEARNLAEERHNHGAVITALRQVALAARPAGDEAWAATKAPAVERLCAGASHGVAVAARDELRHGQRLRALAQELAELFAGAPELLEALDACLAEERGRRVVIATHMHAGDGNVHVNIPVFSNDRAMMARATQAAEDVMHEAVRLGGVVSGEHGIGVTKIAHLDPERLQALRRHRAQLDPGQLLNPGKLDDAALAGLVFTPSFNLLNLEARILQHGQLEQLARKIQACVRCGKCKPDCCVFSPAQALFHHPRNKNLAIGGIIEAVLYDSQRGHGGRFEALRYLKDVADHCTLCHKCLKPCPVDIDTGEVSVLEREILSAHRYRRTAAATGLSLGYLRSRNRAYNRAFKAAVLGLGPRLQRLGHRLLRQAPLPRAWRQAWPLSLLGFPLPQGDAQTLGQALPHWGPRQALLLKPPRPNGKAVFYFPGCGSERLYGRVGQAATWLLLQAGVTVVLPPQDLCCGFPFGANAKTAEKQRLELRNAIVFSQIKDMCSYLDFAAVAVSCGTCMEALQHQAAAEIFGAPVVDVTALAQAQGLDLRLPEAALYHRPCHDSLKGQGLSLLKNAGVRAADTPACCGEAGTLALSRPDIGNKLFERKAASVAAAKAGLGAQGKVPLLTNCPACLQGLGRQSAQGVQVEHLAVAAARGLDADWERKLRSLAQGAEAVTF